MNEEWKPCPECGIDNADEISMNELECQECWCIYAKEAKDENS